MKVRISDIVIGENRRAIDDDVVNNIRESIRSVGLLNPITIGTNNKLIAGAHRLEACRMLGWTEIESNCINLAGLETELAEIDENLIRNDLDVLEQGVYCLRRDRVLEELGIRAKAHRPVKGADSAPLTTTADIAQQAGMSERTFQQRKQIAESLTPEVHEIIRGTGLADNASQLLNLARVAVPKQKEIAEIVVRDNVSVPDAKKEIRKQEIQEQRQEIANSVMDIPQSERWNIWQADIADWQSPQQYDFIITDPPYPKEYLHLYETLAVRAYDWLTEGGLLIAMCGQSYLNQIYDMMSKHMDYYWTASYLTPGQPTPLRHVNVNSTWKPLLIFSKGKYTGKIFGDVFKSDGNDKSLHKWGQSISGMYDIVSKMCLEGQSILDPFCGAGTTGIAAVQHGCIFHGIELLEENVNISKARMQENDSKKI